MIEYKTISASLVMKSRFKTFSCSVFFLLSFILTGFGYADSWMEIKSAHFSVATDAGEKRGSEVAMRFEQMRSVFAALMVKANVNIPVPLQIVAFRGTKEFRQFAPLWHGKPTQLAGLFQPGEDRSFIMLDLSVADPWSVVFHEYAHQLMNGTLNRPLDPWFEEGFAEYFSSIEVDNKEARVGKVPDETYLMLRQANWMKLADLLKVRHYSEAYNESGERRTVFYGESRMLVHYLYDNKLIPKLSTFFDLELDQNVPVEEAVEKTFGMTVQQLDKVVQGYVNSGHYKYYAIPTPADIVTSGYTAAPLTDAGSKAILADIHLHSIDYHDKAIVEFQEVLKEDQNNAAAYRGLGYAYLKKRDFEQAAEYFHHAVQLDSKDPRVHYYSALLTNLQTGFSNRATLPEAIRELETAISLDPSFADPYMLLGFAQASNGDPARGLETMRKAVAMSPRNEGYQFNLAQMYLRNGKFDEGMALLHGLERTQNPQLAMNVNQALQRAQRMKELRQAGTRVQAAPDAEEDASTQTAQTEAPTQLRVRGTRNNKDEIPSKEELAASEAQTPPPKPVKIVPIKYLQGVVKGVDCSTPPSAILTVAAGTKTWKMTVADTNHLIVSGTQKFSCSFSKEKVALNYRETAEGEGSVVSLEIQ
jgi:tetratricopeptide (TPR) repeat protein